MRNRDIGREGIALAKARRASPRRAPGGDLRRSVPGKDAADLSGPVDRSLQSWQNTGSAGTRKPWRRVQWTRPVGRIAVVIGVTVVIGAGARAGLGCRKGTAGFRHWQKSEMKRKIIYMIVALVLALMLIRGWEEPTKFQDCDWENVTFWLRADLTHVDLAQVNHCIAAGTDLEAVNESGMTPLHWAATAFSPEPMEALIQAGANLEAVNISGETPLHKAASESEFVSALLKAGANPNVRDEDGETPLHKAAYTSRKAVKLLLRAGANLEARNKNGETPLHKAAWIGTPEAVAALLDAGADPRARDEKGQTAADWAKDNGMVRNHVIFRRLN